MSTSGVSQIAWVAGAPVLSTPKLTLREPLAEDAEALWRYLTSEEVARLMLEPPSSVDGFRRFFEWIARQRAAGRAFCYAVRPNDRSEPIGLIQVRAVEAGFGIAEWGFCIGQPFWGTGLFVEAAHAVASFLFEHLGIERLEARVATPNARAAGALVKLGAQPEGTLRMSFERSGCHYDQQLWAITRDTWYARQNQVEGPSGRGSRGGR